MITSYGDKKITIIYERLVRPITLVCLITLMCLLSAHKAAASEINEQNLLQLINRERSSRGLKELQIDNDLTHASHLKAKDMLNRDYFEHFYHGITPWDFMVGAGYDYQYGGENLAMDFKTSEGMVSAWMNSSTHRDNILNPNFNNTGIGIVKGTFDQNGNVRQTVMVSNMFGKRKPVIFKVVDSIRKVFTFY